MGSFDDFLQKLRAGVRSAATLAQRRWRRILFYALLAAPALLPLLVEYPPIQDWAGHAGLLGAAIHRNDPAANFDRYFAWRGWLQPNPLFYWVGRLLAFVLPPLLAARVAFALAVGGLGPATAFLCRAVGAEESLAVFALPIALGMHVGRGFIPNALSLVFFALSIGAYFQFREHQTRQRAGLLLLWVLLTALSHFFISVIGFGFIAACAAIDFIRHRRTAVVTFGICLLGEGLVWVTMRVVVGGKSVGLKMLWEQVRHADRSRLHGYFWYAFFANWPADVVDDQFQGGWMVLVLAAIAGALWIERGRFFDAIRLRLLLMLALAFATFAIVPRKFLPPIEWWGANLRLPAMIGILVIPLAGREIVRRWRGLVVAAGTLGMLFVYFTVDMMGEYSKKQMTGLSEVLAAVPPGLTVATLCYPDNDLVHFTDQPLLYVGAYYMLERGGYSPANMGIRDGVLVRDISRAHAPGIWNSWEFSWSLHGSLFDAFVVRPLPTRPDSPFDADGLKNVRLLKQAGAWRSYARIGSPADPIPPKKILPVPAKKSLPPTIFGPPLPSPPAKTPKGPPPPPPPSLPPKRR